MNLLNLLFWAGVLIAVPAFGSSEPRVILSGLGEEGDELLLDSLTGSGMDASWILEPIPNDQLVSRLARDDAGLVDAVVGYPVQLLRDAQLLDELSSSGETWRALWFDPVVYAFPADGPDDPAHMVPPDWLPERLADLSSLAFDERILLEEPRAWNATGALLSAFVIRGGLLDDLDQEDDLQEELEHLDGNVGTAWSSSPGNLLRRVAAADPGILGVSTHRAVSAYGTDVACSIPGGGVFGIFVGSAIVDGDSPGTAPPRRELLERLSDPALVARIGIQADLVPLPSVVPDALDGAVDLPVDWKLPDWMALPRIALAENEAEAWQILVRSGPTVDFFQERIRGSLAAKETVFDEVFDALYLILAVCVVVWILRRRDRDAETEQVA